MFPIYECFESTHSSFLIQREDILRLDWLCHVVFVRLQDNNLVRIFKKMNWKSLLLLAITLKFGGWKKKKKGWENQITISYQDMITDKTDYTFIMTYMNNPIFKFFYWTHGACIFTQYLSYLCHHINDLGPDMDCFQWDSNRLILADQTAGHFGEGVRQVP